MGKYKTKKKYKKCKFDKINRCQKKDSAGHLGTIKSVNKTYCAKKIDSKINNELAFYHRNCSSKKRKICEFIPKYDGLCVDNSKVKHILLEDLTKNMKNPFVMDVKIGKMTASYHQLIGKKKKISSLKKLKYFTKKVRHLLLAYITISNKYGFRTSSIPSDQFKNRLSIGRLHPQKMFSIYFRNDKNNIALTSVMKEMTKINKFVQSNEFDEYSFVGSSILFIFDNSKNNRNKVNVSIIDFNRSRQSKRMTKNAKKYREYFRQGTQQLLTELQKYSNLKDKKTN
tara:strand:+ start:211 stop:1062 length:852 start_codon:yes stop_codon:yes gene_type:complete